MALHGREEEAGNKGHSDWESLHSKVLRVNYNCIIAFNLLCNKILMLIYCPVGMSCQSRICPVGASDTSFLPAILQQNVINQNQLYILEKSSKAY